MKRRAREQHIEKIGCGRIIRVPVAVGNLHVVVGVLDVGELDTLRDDAGAVESVLQLMFLDKLLADIDDAFDELEA